MGRDGLKFVTTLINWKEYNTFLRPEGWEFIKRGERDGTIQVGKWVPGCVPSLVPPYKEYIECLTKGAIRYLLSPISDFQALGGPFYNYYCLLVLKANTGYGSEEYPFILWCYGSDDFMWHKVLKVVEEGHEVMNYMEGETRMPGLLEFIHVFGFVY